MNIPEDPRRFFYNNDPLGGIVLRLFFDKLNERFELVYDFAARQVSDAFDEFLKSGSMPSFTHKHFRRATFCGVEHVKCLGKSWPGFRESGFNDVIAETVQRVYCSVTSFSIRENGLGYVAIFRLGRYGPYEIEFTRFFGTLLNAKSVKRPAGDGWDYYDAVSGAKIDFYNPFASGLDSQKG